jgi:signal transduction histidine kinase
MKRLGPLTWISFSLTCLTLGVLLVGDWLVGLSSGSLNSTVEYRRALSETLAVQYSHMAERNQTDTIQSGLSLLIERNPGILSAAIQLANGTMFAQAGDHRRHWVAQTDNRSTIDDIQVPIFNGDARWGTLQVAFQPAADSGASWSFTHPWTRFLLFAVLAGFIAYFWFIKRTLRQLDPSKVIPPRVKNALDVLAQGVVMLDHEGSIVLANNVFAEKTCLPLKELIGSPLSRLPWSSAISSDAAWIAPWTATLNTQTTQTNVRAVLSGSSSEARQFVVNSAPILDERGHLRGAVVSFDDVTDLEKANVALHHALTSLEQSQQQVLHQNIELEHTNQSLATEITERKKAESEREELNRRLRDASRQIGMAEVAATVLHNVGNVLNSVNVSVNLIQKTLQRIPVDNLGHIGQMVQQHTNDLSTFLVQDEKGKQIPTYLVMLAKQLNSHHAAIDKEVDALSSNIEHIRQVITSQQVRAKSQALLEPIQVTEVIEQALAINHAAVEGAKIVVAREYAALPAITSDRHQVLQILVNLISNAINAMSTGPSHPHCLTLKTGYAPDDQGKIQIQVRDTGVGIKSENFKRLFSQGFTTRTGGQGLGLHGSFLAAKQLQGELSATSKGEGQGATFTLDLPLLQASMAA